MDDALLNDAPVKGHTPIIARRSQPGIAEKSTS
jgi:hypothetical protein